MANVTPKSVFHMYALFIISMCVFTSVECTSNDCPTNCICDSVKNIFNCSKVSAMPEFLHRNNIRVLSIHSHNITEITKTDLQGFYNLHHLDLSNGTIANIAPNAFDDIKEHIEMINLNLNHLPALPENLFSDMPRLKTLKISSNRLKYLNGSLFTNLPKLIEILFEGNAISEVGDDIFENVTALTTLHFFQNKLNKIPFEALRTVPSLVYLHLGFNKITSISDSAIQFQWKNLTEIYIDSNLIADLTAFPNVAPNLKILDLGFNKFSSMSPAAWTNLNPLLKLILNGNRMKTLNAGVFSGLKNLDHLFLRNMPDLETIGPRVFTDLKKLRYIDLARNSKLNYIHEDAFRDTEITWLYLDHNNLTSMSHNLLPLTTLTHVGLSNNSWNCDCKLQWILDSKIVYNSSDVKSKIQSLSCTLPSKLKGQMIKSLKPSQLICPARSEDYRSRFTTGIIVAVVCFIAMTTFAIVMKCRKRIVLRARKYFMYRRFKAGDGVFIVENDGETELEDVDLMDGSQN